MASAIWFLPPLTRHSFRTKFPNAGINDFGDHLRLILVIRRLVKMARLYVLGARQKKLRLIQEEEWNLYETGLILEVDTETSTVQTRVEYQTPEHARSTDKASHIFKAGTLRGNTLYSATATEVLVFRVPEFERIGYVSLPTFNDVHHVSPSIDGNLMAVSTGLDMVIKFTPDGKTLAEWPVLDEDPWARFSRSVDYRKVPSTKPHKAHPNFVFELGKEVWVTRLTQRDAICLTSPGQRIDIAVQRPHDGLVCGDRIYFTTVDGQIVIANGKTHEVDEVIDLKLINGQESLLGWCRGLLPIGDGKIWVAFTRVRKTKFLDNVLWVKKVVREGIGEKPTHIGLYDLAKKQCLAEFDMEPHGLNIIFSIFAAPDAGMQPKTHP
jgi:hypothetical protein